MSMQRTVCVLLTLTLATGPLPGQAPATPGQTAKTVATPGQTAKAPARTSTKSAAGPRDMGWPRVFTDGTATVAVHQPQVEDWKDFKVLIAMSAVEIQAQKGAKKAMAAMHFKAQTETDVSARLVNVGRLEIQSFRIPGESEEKTKELQALVEKLLPQKTDAIALDRILAYLDPSRVKIRETKVSTEPPPIMVSTTLAILVMTDGPPIIAPIQGTKLNYVVNTNWDLIKEDKEYYLLNSSQWLTAKSVEGPWKVTGKLPKEFEKIPPDQNWDDVRKALNPPDSSKNAAAPKVFVLEKPGELILIAGQPQLRPISGTELSEVANTKSFLFFHNLEKQYYFLTAGRWFRSPGFNTPWEYATDKLPPDFAKIPANDPKAAVRASIPGTIEAQDAVLLASVPQTAVINRKAAAAEATVKYVGEPQFKPIDTTTLQYAVNTPSDVIKCQDKYYLLQEGVWFVSSTATGPWEVADVIPQEIYKIPPESPKYNTTYVYVTDSDSESVSYAQTAGYLGISIGFGVAMWGTGWYYPPYYYYGPMYPYPIYWGYPYGAYGAAAWYNPATGFYGRGAVAYGPYGGYGRAAAYNPTTGAYVRRAGAYGPYQAGMATSFYNPRTGTWGAGYRYANAYQGWGQGVVQRGDQWAKGGYYYDSRGAVGGIRTSEGGGMIAAGNGENRGMVGRTSEGDLYVGKDGNIYKRDQSGNWSQRGSNGWNSVDTSKLSAEQQQRLNDAKAKQPQARQNSAQSAGSSGRVQPGTLASGASQSGRLHPGTLPSASEARGGGAGSIPRQPGQSASSLSQSRPSTSEMRSADVNRDVMGGLNRDASARSSGTRNYDSWRSNAGSRPSYSGGGMRGGFGGRRR